MDLPMRILLAEDDPRTASAVADSLTDGGYDVAIAGDGEEALVCLRAMLPRVLLLDLVLPRLDGLAVLSVLPSLRLERVPRVLALSPFRDQRIISRALELGAAKVLPKPLELNRLRASLLDNQAAKTDPDTRREIDRLLIEAGIALHTKGGRYLFDAIAIALQDYQALGRLRDSIYLPIARKYNTKTENVERLVRYAIEIACVRGSIDAMHRLFGQTMRRETGKPTNAEFIANLAENIRLRRS